MSRWLALPAGCSDSSARKPLGGYLGAAAVDTLEDDLISGQSRAGPNKGLAVQYMPRPSHLPAKRRRKAEVHRDEVHRAEVQY